MSMHLEGPWLSTTGKYKGKRKYRNAEEAQKARQAEQDWLALQKKWGLDQQEKKRNQALSAPSLSSTPKIPPGRNTMANVKSLGSGMGVAAAKISQQYTGTKVKGIATMHKSNAVPVFSDEDAVAISKMRR